MSQVKTLQDVVVNSKNNYQNDVALQIRSDDGYKKLTFFDVYQSVVILSSHLQKCGIKHGDKVAILSENRPEWAISYFAIAYLGAIAVPLDPLLSSEELEYIIHDSEIKLISASKSISANHKLSKQIILMEDFETFSDKQVSVSPVSENDLAAIVYTSGTSGRPKGVMLTHKNIVSNVLSVRNLMKIGSKDNFLSILPLHHTFESTCGMVLPFFLGAKVTYSESLKSYNILRGMQETQVTIICGVPVFYNLLLDGIIREVESKGFVMKSLFSIFTLISKVVRVKLIRKILFSKIHKKFGGKLNFFVSGGAAIDPEVVKTFELYGIPVVQGYGLTESSPILSCNRVETNRAGSVGRPIENVEIRLSDVGEIIAKGPNIMKGYYKNPEETAMVLRDGWLYTGDKGLIDKDGYLYIIGRLKDVIVTGAGVNVSPEELESRINKIKGVKESCVIGIKPVSGVHHGLEEVVAVIVPEVGAEESILHAEIQKLNEILAAYKRISKVKFRSTELPKTSTKKIKRFQVKEEEGLANG